MTDISFLDQFEKAAHEVDKLRRMFPECFDEDGRPIVAVAALPFSEAFRAEQAKQLALTRKVMWAARAAGENKGAK
jgi:hypothetical protein